MYTILNPLQIRSRLNEAKVKFFTPDLFMRIFSVSSSKAKYFLERQTQEGLFTRLKTRLFEVQDRHFLFRTIKKQAYTGYFLEKNETKSFLIAEPEKALADYIYFLAQGKVADNDRLFSNLHKVDKTKVANYVKLYDHKSALDMFHKVYARS